MKRTATSELNRDNWDEEDEPEEAGRFKAVAPEELSKRDIKVARRRITKTSDDQKKLFAGFSGFGAKSAPTPDAKSTFSFLSNLNGSSAPQTSNQTSSSSTSSTIETKSSEPKKTEDDKASKESEYLNNLKTLNACVLDWLDKCIKKNPSSILTPIFRDYEKHLESLKKPTTDSKEEAKPPETTGTGFKFNFASSAGSQNLTTTISSVSSISGSTVTSSSIFGSNSPNPLFSKSPAATESSQATPTTTSMTLGASGNSPFTATSSPFGTTTSSWLSSSAVSKSNVFSNLASTTDKPTSQFSFFSNPSAPVKKDEDSANKEEDEEDAPPVNDFKPVTEEGALFSQRVKLFVQKDKQYTDRGVGNLFIKEAKDSKGDKIHQALIRADTSLGNIIFNIRLNPDIPLKRVGKNNVMLVCLPTPDAKPPPVPVLLRVKTSEEADKLLDELNKYK